MSIASIAKGIIQPLRSRKLRVAVATVLVAYLADHGLDVSQELVLTILGVGASLILGIAHEDAGRKASSPSPPGQPPRGPDAARVILSTPRRS